MELVYQRHHFQASRIFYSDEIQLLAQRKSFSWGAANSSCSSKLLCQISLVNRLGVLERAWDKPLVYDLDSVIDCGNPKS